MKTLGMIGGTSWHSTIEYYRYINQLSEEINGPIPINPPLIMYSLNVDIMRRGDWDEINLAYLDIAVTLQNAGAEAIIICANTPHKVIPYVEPKIDVPFIHIADAIGEEANRLNLKKLSLIGTTPVMEDEFIKGKLLSEYKIPTVIPRESAKNEMHRVIAEELTRGIMKEKTKAFVMAEIAEMETRGAEGVILGCTELPLLIKTDDYNAPLLNTTYLHSKKAVDFIFS